MTGLSPAPLMLVPPLSLALGYRYHHLHHHILVTPPQFNPSWWVELDRSKVTLICIHLPHITMTTHHHQH